jgi:hypothetical protein
MIIVAAKSVLSCSSCAFASAFSWLNSFCSFNFFVKRILKELKFLTANLNVTPFHLKVLFLQRKQFLTLPLFQFTKPLANEHLLLQLPKLQLQL